MTDNLTEINFWNRYWSNYSLPSVVDKTFSFERVLVNIFHKYFDSGDKTIIEIGCAPGKWLIYFSKIFNYSIYGIENSKIGLSNSRLSPPTVTFPALVYFFKRFAIMIV